MYTTLAQKLKDSPRDPLNHFDQPMDFKDAAVLVLLYQQDNQDHLVLTKRSEQVEHHKGQVCFPGGMVDATDTSLWDTALRETYEEIGLDRDRISYIGELGQIHTPSGFKVRPFVGHATPPFEWKASPVEIDSIFSVPIDHLLDPQNFSLVTKQKFGQTYQDPSFTYQNNTIWGATGRIVVDFLEVWRAVIPLE